MFCATGKFLSKLIIGNIRPFILTWNVTPKGKETQISIYTIFKDHLGIIVFTLLFAMVSYYAMASGSLDYSNLFNLLPALIFIGNLLLSVLLFGKSRRVSVKQTFKKRVVADKSTHDVSKKVVYS